MLPKTERSVLLCKVWTLSSHKCGVHSNALDKTFKVGEIIKKNEVRKR